MKEKDENRGAQNRILLQSVCLFVLEVKGDSLPSHRSRGF